MSIHCARCECNETEVVKMRWYGKTHSKMQKPHDETVYIQNFALETSFLNVLSLLLLLLFY